jgi:hypothetical protein
LIVLTIFSIIIGLVVSGITGFGIFGLLAGGIIFCIGLPGALIASFIHGEVSYAQDCEDYRQLQSDITAMNIAEEHEYAEDERNERLIETLENNPKQVYYDKRNQHIHLHGRLK